METTEELQQLEITALKSIYDTDFFEPPPPKAWKVRLLVSLYRSLYISSSCLGSNQIARVHHQSHPSRSNPCPKGLLPLAYQVRCPWRSHLHVSIDNLLVRLPKTYPTLATPVFTIQKPTRGFNHEHEVALQKAIHSEAQMLRGSEMVFQVRIY